MSKGSGTIRGYRVEARLQYRNGLGYDVFTGDPPKVGKTPITEAWRRISFTHVGPVGIKNEVYSALAAQNGVLTYAAAMALMTWVASHHRCVEFRLVRVRFAYSYEEQEEGVSEPYSFGLTADRGIEFSPRPTDPTDAPAPEPSDGE